MAIIRVFQISYRAHTCLEAVRAAHGFLSLVFSILGLMNWMLVLLQMLEKNIFSLQNSPCTTHCLTWELGQPFMGCSAQPICTLHRLMCASTQPGTSKVLPLQEWGLAGAGHLSTGVKLVSPLPFVFSTRRTTLKSLTVPNVQISEVDAPPEGDQMPGPAGTGEWKVLPARDQLCQDCCDRCCQLLLIFENVKCIWFKI